MEGVKIEIKNLCKKFKGMTGNVLDSLDLSVAKGEIVTIVGKSGCGKSTLLNILGLIGEFDGGSYVFDDTAIKSGRDNNRMRLERIGFVFQNYNLIPTLTCKENIMLPTMYRRKEVKIINDMVEMMQIGDLLDKRANLLSGGEKQRVAVARALVNDPGLILADEPTGNLDEENKKAVFDIFQNENKAGRTIVLITHDMGTILPGARVYRLEEGRLNEIHI